MDFTFHQSGLNHTQMHIDDDGRYRAVLSCEDPGVPNWLDPLRTPIGQIMLRWYDGQRPALPQVRKVKLDQVRACLPVATPKITPQQRQEVLGRRQRGSLSRWGC
jgi:hypothetical protein